MRLQKIEISATLTNGEENNEDYYIDLSLSAVSEFGEIVDYTRVTKIMEQVIDANCN